MRKREVGAVLSTVLGREKTNEGRGIELRVSLWRHEGRGDREEMGIRLPIG